MDEVADRKLVENEIRQAFSSAPAPRLLLDPQCADDDDVKDFIGQTDWRRVPGDIIDRNNASLNFFSAEALRFFLPAYLLWVLDHYVSSDSFTVDSTLYALDIAPGDRYKGDRFSILNSEQRTAVRAFLLFLKQHGAEHVDMTAVDGALAHFWK